MADWMLDLPWLNAQRVAPTEHEIFTEWVKSDFHPDVAGCTLDEFRVAYLNVRGVSNVG